MKFAFVSINEYYDCFVDVCNKAVEQVAKATDMYQSEIKLDINIYYNVVEYNFLLIFLSWECYLENVFLLYMCGKFGINGNSVNRFVSNVDQERALKMLKGSKEYPDWTNIEFITSMANVFFGDKNPFAFLKNETSIIHIKKIRNRISHISDKCKREYEKVVLEYTGIPSTCDSVSDFLLTYSTDNKSTYFIYFINKLRIYAEIVGNPL